MGVGVGGGGGGGGVWGRGGGESKQIYRQRSSRLSAR